ncbi:MAG: hypothetical protein HRU20_04175 [Pseudomonadales bacterium]|nr:hypothetical protein [Pseudomonadales bacterium]
MIRGPSSVLYATDAFHGVEVLNTFSENKNYSAVNSTISSEEYYNLSLKNATPILEQMTLDLSVDISDQADQHRRHDYAEDCLGADKLWHWRYIIIRIKKTIIAWAFITIRCRPKRWPVSRVYPQV